MNPTLVPSPIGRGGASVGAASDPTRASERLSQGLVGGPGNSIGFWNR